MTETDMAENVQAEPSHTEIQELQEALLGFLWNSPTPVEFSSAETSQVFTDFILGLTFPQAVDVGEHGSKRRRMFTLLSGMWHAFQLQIAQGVVLEDE